MYRNSTQFKAYTKSKPLQFDANLLGYNDYPEMSSSKDRGYAYYEDKGKDTISSFGHQSSPLTKTHLDEETENIPSIVNVDSTFKYTHQRNLHFENNLASNSDQNLCK